MKKLTQFLALICLTGFFVIPVSGEEVFSPVTGDQQVTSKDDVKIQKRVTIEDITDTFYRLPDLRDLRTDKVAARDALDTEIAELDVLIGKVTTEVDKVVLAIPPVADFTATPLTGAESVKVTFSDTTTGDKTSWLWDFGDGTTSELQNPIHTFGLLEGEAAVYTVILTVMSPANTQSKVQKEEYITVTKTGQMEP